MKRLAWNGSKSSKCSPVPMKVMGLLVAATADKAPPPLALPSYGKEGSEGKGGKEAKEQKKLM